MKDIYHGFLRVVIAWLLITPIGCAVASAQTQTDAQQDYIAAFLSEGEDEAYDLILTVQRNRSYLADDLIALQKGLDSYIPLGQLADILQFKADVNLGDGQIKGWFLNEENTYSLDTKAKTYSTGGKTYRLKDSDFIVEDIGLGVGDIYVKTAILNRLWPLDFNLQFERLSLKINTPRQLPFELKRAVRQRRNEFLSQNSTNNDEEDYSLYVPLKQNYKLISKPRLNINNITAWRNEERLITHQTRINGYNDFMGTEADYDFNFDYNTRNKQIDLTRANLTFTKENIEEGDLPFGITSISGGDLGFAAGDRIGIQTGGRGISISNQPLKRSNIFDITNLEGQAEPGWEIELYLNGFLHRVGEVDEDGNYEFENITLAYGKNDIRLLFYGPLGQVREETERIDIQGSNVPKGKLVRCVKKPNA